VNTNDGVPASDPQPPGVERKSEDSRSLLEDFPDTLFVLDAGGRIEDHNAALSTLLGRSREELSQRPLADFILPSDRTGAIEFFRERLAAPSGTTAALDVRVAHCEGSSRWLSMMVMTRAGDAPSLLVSARDETEKRLLYAQREQASRIKSLGRLAMTVAHEFNNVLMGIQPFAELMQRPGVDPKTSHAAGYILSSVGRGKSIVLDIIRFTDPVAPLLAPFELGPWWDRIAPDLLAHTEDSIRFEWSIPAGLFVMADANQLTQIMANLVSNARDAMPRGGELHVEARRPKRHETFPFGVLRDAHTFLQISTSDTGTGMDDSALRHAFDPLFTTKQSRGTGLGLAHVHQVVTGHGGAVFAVSERGAGTTFHVFLPAAP
jgi:PAS domain S-box-containing protein